MLRCPECSAEIDVDEDEVEEGEILSCPECECELEVSQTHPVALNPISDDIEEEEEEDEDEEEDEEEVKEDEKDDEEFDEDGDLIDEDEEDDEEDEEEAASARSPRAASSRTKLLCAMLRFGASANARRVHHMDSSSSPSCRSALPSLHCTCPSSGSNCSARR